MALLRKVYRMCGMRSMPTERLDPVPCTHRALDDGVEAVGNVTSCVDRDAAMQVGQDKGEDYGIAGLHVRVDRRRW